MVRLTEKDYLILRHIEEYQATIEQVALMFYEPTKFNYDYARKRLKALEESKKVSSYIHEDTKRKIYYIKNDNLKKWSTHKMYLMDFYANLVHFGAKIHHFKAEYRWFDGKFYSDGLFKFEYPEGQKWLACVEIDMFSKRNLAKYETIYETEECLNIFGTQCPLIFIVNRFGDSYKYDFKFKEVKNNVTYLNFQYDDFKQKVLVR